MDSVIRIYRNEINVIMDKVAKNCYCYSDLTTLKNHIDGYNARVKWLKSKRRSGDYFEVKYEDFEMCFGQNAIYLKF